jgi:signal peptidase
MAVGALTFLLGALAIVSLHVSTQTVLTGSMRGTFDPGALVFTRQIPVSAIRPGDVIVFTPPGHTTPYTHRVVTVSGSPSHRVVTTKGDANRAPDAWKAQLKGSTVPRVIGHVPYVGRVYVALQGRSLRLALIALLGTVVAVSGTRLLLGSSRQRHQHDLPHPA